MPCSWVARLNTTKTSALLKAVSVVSATLSTLQGRFRYEEKNPSNLHVESQGTPSCQNNFEKEESWRYHAPCLLTIMQSYSHQYSVVQALKTDTKINGTE